MKTKLVEIIKFGKTGRLVSGKHAAIAREDCQNFVSARTASLMIGAPEKHFANLLRTGRVEAASIKDTRSAKFINLIDASVIHLWDEQGIDDLAEGQAVLN